MAKPSNLDSILQHDLLSAEKLINLAGVVRNERSFCEATDPMPCDLPTVSRSAININIALANQLLKALGCALDDGLNPEDWYALPYPLCVSLAG